MDQKTQTRCGAIVLRYRDLRRQLTLLEDEAERIIQNEGYRVIQSNGRGLPMAGKTDTGTVLDFEQIVGGVE